MIEASCQQLIILSELIAGNFFEISIDNQDKHDRILGVWKWDQWKVDWKFFQKDIDNW